MERVLEPELMDTAEDASAYDAMDHSGPNAAFVERLVSLAARGKMLDIGTGPAHIPIQLLETLRDDSTVVAVDAAHAMLEVARKNVTRAGLERRITLVHADAKGLPFPDGSFDVVFSNTILHHIPDPRPFLREALRVLAPGGVILVRDLFRPRGPAEVDALVEQHARGATSEQRALFRASLCAALTPEELTRIVAELGAEGLEVVVDSDRHMSLQTAKGPRRPRLTLASRGPAARERDEPERHAPARAEAHEPRAVGVPGRPPRFARRLGACELEARALDRVLTHVERLIDEGTNAREAKRILGELPKGPYLDPGFHVRVGDAFFDLGKLKEAETQYRTALLRDPASADTLHRLGLVYADTGRDAQMVEVWIQVRRLDMQATRAPWAVTEDEFVQVAEATLARLPKQLRAKLSNLPLVVTDMPSEAMIRDGVDPRIMGLITGVPLSEKGTLDVATPTLDCVQLYQLNIERFSSSPESVREEIGKTVVHEILHYFGFSEEDLERWGLA